MRRMSAFGQKRTFDCPTVRGRYRYAASNSPAVAKRRVGSLASALITTASRAGVIFVMAWTSFFSLAGISSGSNRAVRTFLGLADYRFGFQVLLQPEDPAFPTDPRLFEPTEGSKRIVTYCVDQDAAGGELSRHTVGPFRVRRAYVGDKAEFGVIGDFNGLGFRLVRQYRQNRSEDFFLRDTHVAGDVGEHGGLHEIPTFKSLGMPLPRR